MRGRGWSPELHAVDGAVAADVPEKVAAAEPSRDAVCVLSVGGNDALGHVDLLTDARRDKSAADVFAALEEVREGFRPVYRRAVDALAATGAPLFVCTIYNAVFTDPAIAARAATGVALFNDVIVQEALARDATVVDLRNVCTTADCYANEIEPSDRGGARIADAIATAVERRVAAAS